MLDTPKWREEDGVIRFSVTTDGTTGKGWCPRLKSKGFYLGHHTRSVLCSSDFKPTDGVTTEIAVLKGTLFEHEHRITEDIRAEASKRKLSKPNAEVACLILEMFTDREIQAMDLQSIATMHELIRDAYGTSRLLSVVRYDDGNGFLAYPDSPGSWWSVGSGFAFAVPQA
ncbi:hypothetical protein JXR01_01990 [Candidatus Kaiserbacteria bacterium]|nr:MAG: hypothetical protein JXR01_01990 [Candidatus Kaiserbacteria bacterium]